MATINASTENKAKQVIAEALKKGQIQPCLKIVQAGFHVDTPMDMGLTLLMIVAGVGTEQMLTKVL